MNVCISIRRLILLQLLAIASLRPSISLAGDALNQLYESFRSEYKTWNIPQVDLSFARNFELIPSIPDLMARQSKVDFFADKVRSFDQSGLSDEERIELSWMALEIALIQRRTKLEIAFKRSGISLPEDISKISEVPVSPAAWYQWYVSYWTASQLTPEDIFEFGQMEVQRIRQNIFVIQRKLGFENRDEDFYTFLNSDAFWIRDEAALVSRFEDLQDDVIEKLVSEFSENLVNKVLFQRYPDEGPNTPPGMYDEDVLFYNFYGNKFNLRNLNWLYFHEAIPGHHFQGYASTLLAKRPQFAKNLWYSGFSEGWAAYAEDFAIEHNFYDDIYQTLGKWEWDLVRSARLVLDVGLNLKGWTKQDALAYWHSQIKGQDSIAEREIDRVMRWPAQVMAYKVGEREILKLKQECQSLWGEEFSEKSFHTRLLQRGTMPVEVTRQFLELKCQ